MYTLTLWEHTLYQCGEWIGGYRIVVTTGCKVHPPHEAMSEPLSTESGSYKTAKPRLCLNETRLVLCLKGVHTVATDLVLMRGKGPCRAGNVFQPVPAGWQATCRGTSLIRNSAPLGPYSRTMPRALWKH